MNAMIVTPWCTVAERDAFVEAWCPSSSVPAFHLFQHDAAREGCGATKNRGVRRAIDLGADVVVVLDGDCFPSSEAATLEELLDRHVRALEPQHVTSFVPVTNPASRGTPYGEMTMARPVAASAGFWLEVPDYCAVRQLAHACSPMTFRRESIYAQYFALCGMNLAFKPREWWPWCQFVDVARFDDIWMGWLWQREAYRRGYCFNLDGPLVRHARQSNVWKNLIAEAEHLEANETLWRTIAQHPSGDYRDLIALLPVGVASLEHV